MEKHKLDSFIKNTINESDNFYDSEAISAKKRIWNRIHPQKQIKPLFIRFLAAASILLLISLSVVTYSNIKYKSTINTLIESNTLLKNDLFINKQNLLTKKETIVTSYKHTIDTIYIEKKIIAIKPVVTTKHITDTVYLKQIVYVEKEQDSNLLTTNEIAATSNFLSGTNENNYQSDIIIRNDAIIEKKKAKKIQIKFGGNSSQIGKGTLAARTKL